MEISRFPFDYKFPRRETQSVGTIRSKRYSWANRRGVRVRDPWPGKGERLCSLIPR